MATATYTKAGAKATSAIKLSKDIFDLDVKNHELVKQAYVTYLSNARNASANVKTRGLVRGGGKKPWKQKGTGRARFGSSRNPIWRGGGIVFGPTGFENYTKKLPTKAKRTAIKQALSMANKSGQVSVIETFEIKDSKTSSAVKILNKVNAVKNVLVVVESKDESTVKATSNLQNVNITAAKYVNVYDVLNADTILITKKSLDILDEWLIDKEAK